MLSNAYERIVINFNLMRARFYRKPRNDPRIHMRQYALNPRTLERLINIFNYEEGFIVTFSLNRYNGQVDAIEVIK
jgi:hypothetical protein